MKILPVYTVPSVPVWVGVTYLDWEYLSNSSLHLIGKRGMYVVGNLSKATRVPKP